jgi:recombination protein RecA
MGKASELAKEINKALGAGTVKLGNDPMLEITRLPTGVMPIDVLLDGGIPSGRFTELFGAYSTLKSYIALSCIAQTQASGGVCALIDTEHAYDIEWAKQIGVDTDELIYQSPETGEEAVDVTEVLIRNKVDLVVWDSVAATLPQAESVKRMAKESVQPARLAALMSLAMRKLTAANEKTAVLFINQTRLSVGVVFGDPEVVPGGRALPFYASYRVALRKAGKEKEQEEVFIGGKTTKVNKVTGHKIRATLEKSKLSAPSKDVLFMFDLETGAIDEVGYILSIALEKGLVKHEGRSWWLHTELDQKIVGAEKFIGYLKENPKKVQMLKKELLGLTGNQEADSHKEGKVKK